MKSFKWCLFAVVMFATLSTFGEEAAAVVVEEAGPTGIRAWAIDIAIMVGAFGAAVFTWVIGLGKSKLAKDEAQKEAWDALNAGVTATYETLYQQLKKANGDGKISDAEKLELRNNAIQAAKDIAVGPALEVLKKTALPILHDWVQQIVLKRKTQS